MRVELLQSHFRYVDPPSTFSARLNRDASGLLKHSKSDSSADSFMPMIIYVVLHANPEHLVSNVQYILRFRNQDKLGGEAGYYLSSLVSCLCRGPCP
jgi:Rab5 GDP/GTP exchange factor